MENYLTNQLSKFNNSTAVNQFRDSWGSALQFIDDSLLKING